MTLFSIDSNVYSAVQSLWNMNILPNFLKIYTKYTYYKSFYPTWNKDILNKNNNNK